MRTKAVSNYLPTVRILSRLTPIMTKFQAYETFDDYEEKNVVRDVISTKGEPNRGMNPELMLLILVQSLLIFF